MPFSGAKPVITPYRGVEQATGLTGGLDLAETARFELAGDCSLTDFESYGQKRSSRNLTEDKIL